MLVCTGQAQTIITTVAGSRYVFPPDGIAAVNAPVGFIAGITADSLGNIYFSDFATDRVYRIDGNGLLSAFAGSGTAGYAGDGGPATSAALLNPRGLAVDGAGNLYIADAGNSRIRKVTPAGVITTIAGNGANGYGGDGGQATAASLGQNLHVAVDRSSNVYIADPSNHRIRRVTTDGIIQTFAGTGAAGSSGDGGPAAQATLNFPTGIAFDASGNFYIADNGANRVRKVVNGNISTIAGTGAGAEAGDGGPATAAKLNAPAGVAVDLTGAVFIADQNGSRLRRIEPRTNIISTIAGTSQVGLAGDGGPAAAASLYGPQDLAFTNNAQTLLIADSANFRVRSLANGVLTTIAGNGNFRYTGDGGAGINATLPSPDGLAIDSAGNVNICDGFANRVRTVSIYGVIRLTAGTSTPGFAGDGSNATAAKLVDCGGIAVDGSGNLYVADTHNRRIRKISAAGVITTVAGNGVNDYSGDLGSALNAALSNPQGVALDASGSLYIADTGNNRIRRVTPAGLILTVAGTGDSGYSGDNGLATAAVLNSPSRLTVDAGGDIYFSDNGNNVVRRISAGGTITTVAGNGQYGFSGDGGAAMAAMLANPQGLAVDGQGGVYIADADNRRVRYVDAKGVISTIAGNGSNALAGDGRPPLSTGFGSPTDVALDGAGNIYIADQNDGRVRVIRPKPPLLVISQTGFTVTTAVDGGLVGPRTLTILNGGAGTVGWSVSTSVLSGTPGWLSVSPAQGTSTGNATSSPVTVTVNPGGLASGNYYGQIEIVSPGVANSPRFVTVVLNVLSATQTTGPVVSPAGVVFTAAGGVNPPAQNLTLSLVHGGNVTYTSAITYLDSNQWLTATPASGTVTAAKAATVALQANVAGLAAGVYSATLKLTFSGGGVRNVPVTLTVSAAASVAAAHLVRPRATTCTPTQLLPTVTAISQGFSVAAGWPTPLQLTVVDDCGQPLVSGSLTVTFSNGDPPLALSSLQDGTWSGTWSPRSAATVNIEVLAQSSGTPVIRGIVQISGQVNPNTEPPIINTGGILNSASFAAGEPATPGALMTIFGANLATGTPAVAKALPLPTTLAGAQVLIGGTPMPLLYAGPTQINAVVPYNLPVNTTQQVIVISGSALSVPEGDAVAPGAPAVFTLDGSGVGNGIVVAVNPDGTAYIVSPSHPAHPGSVIVVYCTGLGGVQSSINAGDSTPLSPLAPTTDAVTLTIGGKVTPVAFAGLTPTLSGLYQVNAVIQAGTPTGDAVPLILNAVGTDGPAVSIAIH